jgi:hypothetical protein
MEYRGHVKDGVVVFEAGAPPEGASVRVHLVDSKPEQTLWQKLRKYSGAVTDLPSDMARNHDHYIHGGPRK